MDEDKMIDMMERQKMSDEFTVTWEAHNAAMRAALDLNLSVGSTKQEHEKALEVVNATQAAFFDAMNREFK